MSISSFNPTRISMNLNKYIAQANQDSFEGALSFSCVPSQRKLVTTKTGRASLPYWYGIKPIRFIWRGEWADPDICYNQIVVNSYVVEDTMYEQYREYCQQEGQPCLEDGFAEYMRNNKHEIVKLIYQAHNTEN